MPFRGGSPDSGTIWELGYAYALGKAIAAWSTVVSCYYERIDHTIDGDCSIHDRNGWIVEDFEMFDNAMICGPLLEQTGTCVFPTFEEALASVQRQIIELG